MNFIVDLLLAAVVICFVINGKKRGFVRTLLSFVARLVSFFAALFVSKTYSEKVYELFLKKRVMDAFNEKIITDRNGVSDISEVLNEIPELIREMLGLDVEALSEALKSSQIANDVTVLLEENIFSPVIILICQILIFTVVSTVVSIILGVIINAICNIVKLPILRGANGVLGAVLGFLNATVCVYIISFVLTMVSVLINNSEFNKIIASSYIIEICTSRSFI